MIYVRRTDLLRNRSLTNWTRRRTHYGSSSMYRSRTTIARSALQSVSLIAENWNSTKSRSWRCKCSASPRAVSAVRDAAVEWASVWATHLKIILMPRYSIHYLRIGIARPHQTTRRFQEIIMYVECKTRLDWLWLAILSFFFR